MAVASLNEKPAEDNWGPGHVLRVATIGNPAEVDALSKQMQSLVKHAGDAVESRWQDRERERRTCTTIQEIHS